MFNSTEFNALLGEFQGVLPDIRPGRFSPNFDSGVEGNSGIWARFYLGRGGAEPAGEYGGMSHRRSTFMAYDLAQEAIVALFVSAEHRRHRRDPEPRPPEENLSHWLGLLMSRVEPLEFVGDWHFAGASVNTRGWMDSGTHPYLSGVVTTLWKKPMYGRH